MNCSTDYKEIAIRPSCPEDIDAIASVFQDGKAALAQLGISQWQNTPYPSRTEAQQDACAGSSFVAIDAKSGLILGVATLELFGEPTYDKIDGSWLTVSQSTQARYATIHRTCVGRGAARRGVMSRLFENLEQRAREAGKVSVRIDTHPENTPMRSLLLKRGYVYCGTISLGSIDPDPLRDAFEKLL